MKPETDLTVQIAAQPQGHRRRDSRGSRPDPARRLPRQARRDQAQRHDREPKDDKTACTPAESPPRHDPVHQEAPPETHRRHRRLGREGDRRGLQDPGLRRGDRVRGRRVARPQPAAVRRGRPAVRPPAQDHGQRAGSEYEKLVSLAQLKVHSTATVTLAIKNIAMSYPAAGYYGYPRVSQERHPHNILDGQAGVSRRHAHAVPDRPGDRLGQPAMIGKGPIGGKAVETGLVIAGRNPVSVDSVGAYLLGFETLGVQHIRQAEQMGLGHNVHAHRAGGRREQAREGRGHEGGRRGEGLPEGGVRRDSSDRRGPDLTVCQPTIGPGRMAGAFGTHPRTPAQPERRPRRCRPPAPTAALPDAHRRRRRRGASLDLARSPSPAATT